MKKTVNKGLVIGFAAIALGALAVTPRLSYGDDPVLGNRRSRTTSNTSDPVIANTPTTTNSNGMSPEAQQGYRDGYNQAFQKAKEAEQQKLDDSGSSSGGCCG